MKLALLFLAAIIAATAANYQLDYDDLADLKITEHAHKSHGHYRYAPVYLHRPAIYRARRYVAVEEPLVVEEGPLIKDMTEQAGDTTIMEPVSSLEIVDASVLAETSDAIAETATEVLAEAMVEQGPGEDSGLTPPTIYYRARRYVTEEESSNDEDNSKHAIVVEEVFIPSDVDEIADSDASLLLDDVETATNVPVMGIVEKTQAQDSLEHKSASKAYYKPGRNAAEQQAVIAKEVGTTSVSEELAPPLSPDVETATEAVVEQDALAKDSVETPTQNYYRTRRYAVTEPAVGIIEESIAKDVVEHATEAVEVTAVPEHQVIVASVALSAELSAVNTATEVVPVEVTAEQGLAAQNSEQPSSKAYYKTRRYAVYESAAKEEEAVTVEEQFATSVLADNIDEMIATEIPVQIIAEQSQTEADDEATEEAEEAGNIAASQNNKSDKITLVY